MQDVHCDEKNTCSDDACYPIAKDGCVAYELVIARTERSHSRAPDYGPAFLAMASSDTPNGRLILPSR